MADIIAFPITAVRDAARAQRIEAIRADMLARCRDIRLHDRVMVKATGDHGDVVGVLPESGYALDAALAAIQKGGDQ